MKKVGRIKVEGVQAIITTSVKKGRPAKYPFDALKVGQTFWVPDNGGYTAIYVAVWRHNKVRTDQTFALMKGDRNGKPGFRVQRTK